MKNKFYLFFALTPICILFSGCANSNYLIKTTNGSKILFKDENVSCEENAWIPFSTKLSLDNYSNNKPIYDYEKEVKFIDCTASGLLTDLAGNSRVYSKKANCSSKSNEIPCLVGKYFKKYSEDYFLD